MNEALRDLNDASHMLWMLSDYQQQLPPKRPIPHIELWDCVDSQKPETAVKRLQQHAGSDLDFFDFHNLALQIARLYSLLSLKPITRNVLELVERRLLSHRQRTPRFRELVQSLLEIHRLTETEPVDGSTPEARRQFEWYSADHDIPSRLLRLYMDMLHGCGHYRELRMASAMNVSTHDRFARQISDIKVPAIYIDGSVVVGAESPKHLNRATARVKQVVQRCGISFLPGFTARDTTSITTGGFRFCRTKIARSL